MKKTRWFLIILSIFCAVIWLGCGDDDDDDDDNDDNDTNGTVDGGGDLVGTWKLVAIQPPVEPLPEQTLTVKSDGAWTSTTRFDVPGLGTFTITSEGAYQVSGNTVTGAVTETKIEPDLGVPIPTSDLFTGSTTYKVEGNKATFTSTEGGTTTITTYEKQ